MLRIQIFDHNTITINTFIQQYSNKLIKSDSKVYNVVMLQNILFQYMPLNELSIHHCFQNW